jgi:hypothetical protein
MNPHIPHTQVIGYIVTTVVLFIFIFASASSWILFVSHALGGLYEKTAQSKFNTKVFGVFALCLTVVTIGLAIGFGYMTKDTGAGIPIDASTIIRNVRSAKAIVNGAKRARDQSQRMLAEKEEGVPDTSSA